jgi:hypothetical protein
MNGKNAYDDEIAKQNIALFLSRESFIALSAIKQDKPVGRVRIGMYFILPAIYIDSPRTSHSPSIFVIFPLVRSHEVSCRSTDRERTKTRRNAQAIQLS